MSYYASGGHDAKFLLTDSSGRQWRITFDEDRHGGARKYDYTAYDAETGERHFIHAFTYAHPSEAQLVMLADAGWPDDQTCHDLLKAYRAQGFTKWMSGLTDEVAA